ncbi:disease resistance protein Roq1-like [Rhodamnia argentea]|uniref:Disease resistance protein Roq1-like n=1 Tax=Rhodamnia argentea TaxID=178133 RepID=A0ABM3H883_9MYRT|nr:disease resistance protein Roq1-like [Rhodamnia argentea]
MYIQRDCAVKAIVLELPKRTEICIGPDAFTKPRKLKLLILRNVSFQGPVCLPNQLRYLEWAGCIPWIPEFSSGPNKLVVLDVSGGRMLGEPKQFEFSQGFQNLKYISFYECGLLVCTPNLSCTPNLMELEIQSCDNLEVVHESIANHDKLQVVDINDCPKLHYFPILHSKTLQALRIEECEYFERFPDIPHELEGLKELCFRYTAIEEVPTSIEYLVSLRRMCLGGCDRLISLSSSIYKLQNLEELELNECKKLTTFPKYDYSADSGMKTGLPKLRKLDFRYCSLFEVEFLENLFCVPLLESLELHGNEITSLPTSIHKRDHLSTLIVSWCDGLREIPKLPPYVILFDAQNHHSLKNTDHLTSLNDFVCRGLAMADISSQVRLSLSLSLSLSSLWSWKT